MLRAIKKRLRELEQRIWAKLPFWPGDGDDFLECLGVDKEKYSMENPDGSIGYDVVRALGDTAAEDWRPDE